MADPIKAQGAEAKKLDLTEDACPYGPGDNRDAWLEGFNGKKPKAEKPAEDVVTAAEADAIFE